MQNTTGTDGFSNFSSCLFFRVCTHIHHFIYHSACQLFSNFHHWLSTYITHISNTVFPQLSCHFLQLLTTTSFLSNPLDHSFPANTSRPTVALVALVLAAWNPESADLLWLCSCPIFFFFLHFYRCQPSLHAVLFFFFSFIKDVSVCDTVARGGGGVEAKLFHLKQLKAGSIPT